MNKIKIYLRTNSDLHKMSQEYINVFKGKILKESFINKTDYEHNLKTDKDSSYDFAYIQILNDINLLIAPYKAEYMPTWGYSQDNVLFLESLDLYNEIYLNLIDSKSFNLIYGTKAYQWGTQISKFTDIWGNHWILECKI